MIQDHQKQMILLLMHDQKMSSSLTTSHHVGIPHHQEEVRRPSCDAERKEAESGQLLQAPSSEGKRLETGWEAHSSSQRPPGPRGLVSPPVESLLFPPWGRGPIQGGLVPGLAYWSWLAGESVLNLLFLDQAKGRLLQRTEKLWKLKPDLFCRLPAGPRMDPRLWKTNRTALSAKKGHCQYEAIVT
ncbi:proline-rich protein 3-like [Phacochoerus africanus]|uniref:proline-rich protein 3-like n=1 Tax=Phacochoerus africanus TaxID=41426 RepID=UPI001FD9CF5A|nr:proline-rich protein 3-like [Phacochoerus africanus]